ncbi:MAG: hypothetical protein ACR2MO_00265 [Acidimicrobiales bacterium]
MGTARRTLRLDGDALRRARNSEITSSPGPLLSSSPSGRPLIQSLKAAGWQFATPTSPPPPPPADSPAVRRVAPGFLWTPDPPQRG